MFIPLTEMNAYLKKEKKMGIGYDLWKIMCWNLCKIYKNFLQFPIKPSYYHVNHFIHDELIYHKNLSHFFPGYLHIHLGNTLLVKDMPYKTYLKPSFNAIFVKSYEHVPKEDNYLVKTIFPYLKFFHNFRLSVSTFVEFYPFSTIRSIKDDDVGF